MSSTTAKGKNRPYGGVREGRKDLTVANVATVMSGNHAELRGAAREVATDRRTIAEFLTAGEVIGWGVAHGRGHNTSWTWNRQRLFAQDVIAAERQSNVFIVLADMNGTPVHVVLHRINQRQLAVMTVYRVDDRAKWHPDCKTPVPS